MTPTESTLVLTGEDVQALLGIDECIVAVEEAFRLLGQGTAEPPGSLGTHCSNGAFHVKAGVLQLQRSYYAAKVNANFPNNRLQHGLPTIQGVLVLCDAANGRTLAVMDSVVVTAVRTGAATAVAANRLARKDAAVVTVCGCGTQGRVHLKSLARVRKLKHAFAADLDRNRALEFTREMEKEVGIPISVVEDAASGARQSDICVMCTTSRKAILGASDVPPGAFVAAVGADNPEKQELDPSLFRDSKVVVDLLTQCRVMGDLHHALKAGTITEQRVHAELGEIVAGRKPARESAGEIIIFDSTGIALQDVAAAAVVYEKAIEQGRGTELNFRAKQATIIREQASSSTSAM
jgi:alanine dehydrogenase